MGFEFQTSTIFTFRVAFVCSEIENFVETDLGKPHVRYLRYLRVLGMLGMLGIVGILETQLGLRVSRGVINACNHKSITYSYGN